MKINEVAARLQLSPRAIRFYEEKGLIAPEKEPDNGYRRFSEEDAWRLQLIASLREVGFPLDDIGSVLRHVSHGDADGVQACFEMQRSALYMQWVELKQLLDTMERMTDRAGQGEPAGDDWQRLAEASRQLRQMRADWRDRWNYDGLAGSFDETVAAGGGEEVGFGPFGPGYAEALALAAERLDPSPGEEGLDAGTGTGNMAGLLLRRGARMAGIDQSLAMIRQCRAKYPQMETKLGNVLAIPFFDGRFRFVVSTFALQHLNDRQQSLAIREFDRVVSAGGRIAIVDRLRPTDAARVGDASAMAGGPGAGRDGDGPAAAGGQAVGRESGQGAGRASGQGVGRVIAQGAGRAAGHAVGQAAGQAAGRIAAQESGKPQPAMRRAGGNSFGGRPAALQTAATASDERGIDPVRLADQLEQLGYRTVIEPAGGMLRLIVAERVASRRR